MGLHDDSRGLDITVVREAEDVTEGSELDSGEPSTYRQPAATVNCLAMDRLDVQCAASFLGRAKSRPTVQSMAALKRVARYFLKRPSMQFEYWLTPISEASVLEGCSNSDLAGCLTTSRSMSGGVVTLAGRTVKSWSNRQDSVVLSSGEAEYYACVKAAAELVGLRSLATDLVWNVGLLEN